MSYYEYRVVPAPRSLPKVKGVKGPEGRFAVSMAEALNAEGREGWEFQRSETITTELKRGFLSKKRSETLSVLVFRRWVEVEEVQPAPPAQFPAPQRTEAEEAPQASRPVFTADPAARGTGSASGPSFSARRGEGDGQMPSLDPPRRD